MEKKIFRKKFMRWEKREKDENGEKKERDKENRKITFMKW